MYYRYPAQALHLFMHTYPAAALAQRRSEKVPQRIHCVYHRLIVADLGLPQNGIQRVVQKMRINLRLQQIQFGFLQCCLSLQILLRHSIKLHQHIIEALSHIVDFIMRITLIAHIPISHRRHLHGRLQPAQRKHQLI